MEAYLCILAVTLSLAICEWRGALERDYLSLARKAPRERSDSSLTAGKRLRNLVINKAWFSREGTVCHAQFLRITIDERPSVTLYHTHPHL
jgi:hypothetical protein